MDKSPEWHNYCHIFHLWRTSALNAQIVLYCIIIIHSYLFSCRYIGVKVTHHLDDALNWQYFGLYRSSAVTAS